MDHHSFETGTAPAGQKNKPLLGTQTLIICLAVIAIAITAVTVFRVSAGSLFFIGALIACPLMHLFMMKKMIKKHD